MCKNGRADLENNLTVYFKNYTYNEEIRKKL